MAPLILNTGGAFNTPLGITTCTPAALPPKACSKLCVGLFAKASPLTLAILPVISLFFCVPYPTTTTSFKALSSGDNETVTVDTPVTLTSLASNPT